MSSVVIALGSQNKAKIAATEQAGRRLFKEVEVKGFTVPSDVSAQPMSDEETMQGAINRAKKALASCEEAKYGIGLEGGVHQCNGIWLECGWSAVVDREGKVGVGTSARFQLANHIVDKLKTGKELAEVIDDLSGKEDVRSNEGAMGIITNGALGRAEAYAHGLLFAFGPFVSDAKYWD